MGYTMMTCTRCGDSTKIDYTKATGHKPGDWIIDKQPTADSEGSKHKECTECGKKLDTQPIEKIYNSGTTDSKGQAVVGGYLVTVTDTEDNTPVSNASVVLNKDNSISIRLPNSRLLDYDDQTTVLVQWVKDKSAVRVCVSLSPTRWITMQQIRPTRPVRLRFPLETERPMRMARLRRVMKMQIVTAGR